MADSSEPTAEGGSGKREPTELKPKLTVVGVGGAGCNAVNNMIRSQLEGVEFVVANTDAQSLKGSIAENCIQMGGDTTNGLGTGARVEVGRVAAEESIDQITERLEGSSMAFVAAGLGGGTGTGAAPVIAMAAREQGILTVGVVSLPFEFEGGRRRRIAEEGLQELEQFVDTMIVIPNQNLFKIADENTSFVEAFKMADDVLYSAVRGVTDLIVLPGLVNLDFADIQAVMKETGKAVIATGEAEGDRRAIEAAEKAIANPLLDSPSIRGARGLLINITGGSDMALFEVDVAANRVRAEVDDGCFTIFGSALDESLDGKLRVSVVASGIGATDTAHEAPPEFGVEPSGEPPQEETEQTREESEETLLPLPETAESEAEPEIEDEESPADKLGILKVPSTVTLAELGEPRSAAPEKLTPENFAPENIGLENIAIEPAANDPVPTSGAEGEEPSTRSPENDEVAKDGDPFLAAVQEGVKAANPETDEEGGKGLLGRVSRLFKS